MKIKEILLMYLALLIWITKIIMFASIVLIPIVVLLTYNYDWWTKPFETAYETAYVP